MPLKLTIELVPKTSWYSNLRNVIRPAKWDKLRKSVYAEYEHKCGICGATGGRLNCHEIWEYIDTNHEQKLIGFIAL
jgi:predicted restriction endonuclease